MPRMPMIEAAAKTLLLLTLLLTATISSARSVPTTEVIEQDETTTQPTTTEEYSTFSSIPDMNTESVSQDANEIGITEEDQETFTSLPELGLTTSVVPLESVTPGEQAQREDAEWHELSNTMTTTENPNLSEPLVDTTTTTAPAITTTMLPITETTALPEEPSRMEEMATESQGEETTLTTEVSEPIEASQMPLKQEPSVTNEPLRLEAATSITEPNMLQQITWTSNLVEMAESTMEAGAVSPVTTEQPEPEPQPEEVSEADKIGTESTVQHMPETISIEPVRERFTTEEPTMQPELTTTASAQEIATTTAEGETTIKPPKPEVSLADTAESPATTEAAESETDSDDATNIISTTEPIVVPTTEQKPQSTRAPRVERIFNPDGVEVLYGYSNVVRTNRA